MSFSAGGYQPLSQALQRLPWRFPGGHLWGSMPHGKPVTADQLECRFLQSAQLCASQQNWRPMSQMGHRTNPLSRESVEPMGRA